MGLFIFWFAYIDLHLIIQVTVAFNRERRQVPQSSGKQTPKDI